MIDLMRLGLVVLSVLLFSHLIHADFPREDSIGPGVMIGNMGSISGKYFVTDVDAVDAGIEFMDRPWSVIYADYYRHFPQLFGKHNRFGRETSPYFEFGTGAGFWDRSVGCARWHCTWNAGTTGTGNGFFVRLLVGLEWYPRKTPFSVFTELGPSYLWYPTDGHTFELAVGGRYYF